MKTKTLKNKAGKFFFAIMLVLGMGWSTANACTANFNYTTGPNGQVFFTSTVSGFVYTPWYVWNPGDLSGPMWGATPSHQYLANGTYTVSLVVSDSMCTDTVVLPVVVTNVTQPCNLAASYIDTNRGHGVIKFTSTSVGVNANTLYFWTFGDGSPRVQGNDTITHKYIYNGAYTATLTIEDTGLSYCIDSTSVQIAIYNADSNGCNMLHPNFIYSFSPNGQVSFTSTSLGVQGGAIYSWNPGDGSPLTMGYYNTYGHQYQSNNTFNVTLTIIQDSGFCRDSITIPVTVTNVVAPCNMAASFTMVKDSDGLEHFTSTSSGVYSFTKYYWNFGDGSPVDSGVNLTSVSHTYPFIGYYNPTLTLLDTGLAYCTAFTWDTLYIRNRDSLQASFYYYADSLNAGKYDFVSNSQGVNAFTYYKWNPGDGDPADSGIGMSTYTHTYISNGPYSATLTIWYTQIPHRVQANRYSESSYTKVVNVNTVNGIASVSGGGGSELTLYPNPSNGQFRIKLSDMPAQSQNVEVNVSNILGESIYTTTYSASSSDLVKDIDMQSAPAGVYFVRILTSNKVFTARMVIGK